jgi:hypothetical protein
LKTRTILTSLVAFFAGLALCYAADLQMGTWKLNGAKSKFNPGATKNTTVVYAPAGDMVKVTVEGVDKDGKAVRNEWTGKFDGKDYPVTGNPNEDTRAYKKIDDQTLDFTSKKGDKSNLTGRVMVSADGKSRTVTTTATEAGGKKTTNKAVYDKQQ